MHKECICQEGCGAAEGVLAQKSVLKDLHRDGFGKPFSPDTLNADDGVSLFFIVECVRQRPRKSPCVFEVEKRRSGRQRGRFVADMCDYPQIGLLARGSNIPLNFARAFAQFRLAQAISIVCEQVSSGHHPPMIGIASQNSQSSQ